jgi:hypothetical protein
MAEGNLHHLTGHDPREHLPSAHPDGKALGSRVSIGLALVASGWLRHNRCRRHDMISSRTDHSGVAALAIGLFGRLCPRQRMVNRSALTLPTPSCPSPRRIRLSGDTRTLVCSPGWICTVPPDRAAQHGLNIRGRTSAT